MRTISASNSEGFLKPKDGALGRLAGIEVSRASGWVEPTRSSGAISLGARLRPRLAARDSGRSGMAGVPVLYEGLQSGPEMEPLREWAARELGRNAASIFVIRTSGRYVSAVGPLWGWFSSAIGLELSCRPSYNGSPGLSGRVLLALRDFGEEGR